MRNGALRSVAKGSRGMTNEATPAILSYCSDSPLSIIMIATYSNVKPPSKSASLLSCLRNAPYLLASCYTFCLNPRQSSRGLCWVQVVISKLRNVGEKPALKDPVQNKRAHAYAAIRYNFKSKLVRYYLTNKNGKISKKVYIK